MSNLQTHVMLSLSEKLLLTCHQSWQRDREEGLQVPSRFLDEAELLGLELDYTYTYRYPLQMRKALGWYVRNAFSFMASQNIPSQSCTHLLRILLVMVMVLLIKELAIRCSFQGLLSTSLVVGLLQHAKSGCYQDHPSSSSTSYAGRPQASKLLLLLCLCEAPPTLHLWSSFVCACEHKGGFSGAILVSKTGFVGPNWVRNCVYWVKTGV